MEEVRITYILIHLSSIHTIITGYKIADPDRNCFLLNHSPAAPADSSEPHIFHSVIMASGMEGRQQLSLRNATPSPVLLQPQGPFPEDSGLTGYRTAAGFEVSDFYSLDKDQELVFTKY